VLLYLISLKPFMLTPFDGNSYIEQQKNAVAVN